jgi:hypothetical protein
MIAIFALIAALIIICVMLILIPKADNQPEDLSGFNGFYKISYNEGYNFAYKDSSDDCNYAYKGILLRDGDRILQARVLYNTQCKWCGKNETMSLPAEDSKVVLDIEGVEGSAETSIAFSGKIAELRDFQIIQ